MQRRTDQAAGARFGGRPAGPAAIRRILVPLDGNELSAAVLPDALALTGLSGAELVLATVLPLAGEGGAADRQAADAYLRRHLDAVRGRPVEASAVLLHGDPVEQLLGYALGNDVDAIAMATRALRHGGGPGGSVTDALVCASPVPVLLRRVPAAAGAPALAAAPRILVPLDGSRLAELVVPAALDLAAVTGGSVLLLQVIDEALDAGSRAPADRDLVTRELRAAHEYLAALAQAQRGRRVPIETTVRLGRPAESIAWAALDGGMGLIAMATHGRSGARRERLGSVAFEVLRGNTAPLLLLSGAALPPGPDSPARRPATAR